ncbi:MAG TPA: UTP--glucose-1-phosphate uridylyltransferase [Demequinaceae bacterium]
MALLGKAVIPAAGRGTRSLPASKAIPKEIIPLVDRPAIQYVVEEAVAAGCDDIAIVTAPGKASLAAHFAPDPALEAALRSTGSAAQLEAVRHASALGPLTEILQDEPRGLGHAVACAEEFAAGEAFAVLLADDLLDERDPALATMMAIHARTGASVVLLMDVPRDKAHLYGSVDPMRVDPAALPGEGGVPADAEIHRLTRLIEKPAPGEEYSTLAIIGRYVFTPAIFDALRTIGKGSSGEIQLTEAINELAHRAPAEGGGVYGLVFRGRRYDTGDRLEYLKATVQVAADRPDLGPDFLSWLRTYVKNRGDES